MDMYICLLHKVIFTGPGIFICQILGIHNITGYGMQGVYVVFDAKVLLGNACALNVETVSC